jgi:SAM-dependent methyltransferase
MDHATMFKISPDRHVGRESRKLFGIRLQTGFWTRYAALGDPLAQGLDIGARGGDSSVFPILPSATAVELGDPGYTGIEVPYPANSMDYVHSSHVLEHMEFPHLAFSDWFRVLKIGGHIICFVPSMYRYEKKRSLPSQWSTEHRAFYTPGSLLTFVEHVLEPNTYLVEHVRDAAEAYSWHKGPAEHPDGALEIELVVRKIKRPLWNLAE